MKELTRRKFLRLSGAAAFAVTGMLTGCSGGGGSGGAGEKITVIDDSDAVWVDFVWTDQNGNLHFEGQHAVGDFEIYPLMGAMEYTQKYGTVFEMMLTVKNNGTKDVALDKTKVMLCLDGTPQRIIALEGGDMGLFDEMQSSITLKAGEESSVCVYADVNGAEDSSYCLFVMQLGDVKVKAHLLNG